MAVLAIAIVGAAGIGSETQRPAANVGTGTGLEGAEICTPWAGSRPWGAAGGDEPPSQATIDRQLWMTVWKPQLEAGFGNRFAGFRIEHGNDSQLVVRVADATPDDAEIVAGIIPATEPWIIENAVNTETELVSQQRSLLRWWDQLNAEGYEITTTGVDIWDPTGSVRVELYQHTGPLCQERLDQLTARILELDPSLTTIEVEFNRRRVGPLPGEPQSS